MEGTSVPSVDLIMSQIFASTLEYMYSHLPAEHQKLKEMTEGKREDLYKVIETAPYEKTEKFVKSIIYIYFLRQSETLGLEPKTIRFQFKSIHNSISQKYFQKYQTLLFKGNLISLKQAIPHDPSY